MYDKGFSLLEVLVGLLVVSLVGVSVQTQIWQHWRWVRQQQTYTMAVLQLRNFIQQQLVTPRSRQTELFQHWQRQHAHILPGSRSHQSMEEHTWRVVLGWPMVDEDQPSPHCQQAGIAMPHCLIIG